MSIQGMTLSSNPLLRTCLAGLTDEKLPQNDEGSPICPSFRIETLESPMP